VICANPEQWQFIQPVALQGAGEPVRGALLGLIQQITLYLANNNAVLSNDFLEWNTIIHPLIDGVDSTLIELLSDEIGDGRVCHIGYGAGIAHLPHSSSLYSLYTVLRSVFALRASRLVALRVDGKITWARQTWARVRLIDSVEQELLPCCSDWQANADPLFRTMFACQSSNGHGHIPNFVKKLKHAST
jgi:hypothetical protein